MNDKRWSLIDKTLGKGICNFIENITGMKSKVLILACAVLLAGCSGAEKDAMTIEEVIREGNIVSTEYAPDTETGCYLANGRFGTVFNGLGLNNGPTGRAADSPGASHFSHLRHWGRFSFTSKRTGSGTSADYLLPLFRVYWENEPGSLTEYRQEQDFYDGVLRTSFTDGKGVGADIQGWFDMEDKDLAGFRINVRGGCMSVRMATETDFDAYSYVFSGKVRQSTFVERHEDCYKVCISCDQTMNNCDSAIYVYCSSPVEICGDGLRILLEEGSNDIFLSYGHPSGLQERAESMDRTIARWHKVWDETGWMHFPDKMANEIYVRSLAYLLESYNDVETSLIQPVSGLSGNPFPFHFVQDLEYIAPALMMTGHQDIVRKWVEKFTEEEGDLRMYARKLWPGSDGIYPPWELPYGPVAGYHEPEVPVMFCYEPHNTGYLARMAYEASELYGDKEWTDSYAAPLVYECAKFYQSASYKGGDGKWHLKWLPSVGQDEAGGRDMTDYLCSMYSARYSFAAAIAMGLDQEGLFRAILDEGLDFNNLIDADGILHTSPGADEIGRQKHPVQLDGITYFPHAGGADEAEKKAYRMRHDLTDRAGEPYFFGWTLGQLLLAGSNLGDAEGWKEDWSSLLPSGYCDDRFIQIYETSGKTDFPFYVTTHGMILQSLIRNYVNDYWGKIDISGCNIFEDKELYFGNITTKYGVKVSGHIVNNTAKITLNALRDTKFEMNGEEFNMKAGDTAHCTINL